MGFAVNICPGRNKAQSPSVFLTKHFFALLKGLSLRINILELPSPYPPNFLYPSKCPIIRAGWLRKIFFFGKVEENYKVFVKENLQGTDLFSGESVLEKNTHGS